MRVPVYEQLKLKETDVMSLVDILRKSKVGKGPTYIDLTPYEERETYFILETLQEALKILKVSAYCPYPLYVLTPYSYPEIDIPTLPSETELPAHFFNRIKRLNSKELDLVNKIGTLTERINNQPIEARRREMKKNLSAQKQLFLITKQQDFYEHLLKKLHSEEGKA